MQHGSPSQQLAEMLIDEPLVDFLDSRRPDKSWRLIARDLYEKTEGRVDITPEQLRKWHDQLTAKQAN